MWARIFIFSFLTLPLSAKIISLDLGADQWVLGLAKKEDIYAVSYLAKDADMSYQASSAEGLPTHTGTPEEFLDPAIKTMIGYEPISPLIKKLCQKKGITLIALSYPHSFQQLKEQITDLCRFFDQRELGNKWIQKLSFSSGHPHRIAAFYGAQGLSPGNNTLLNEVLQVAGYKNLYAHKNGWTYNNSESLLASSLSAIFFTDPTPSHQIWQWMRKKKVTLKTAPYRLTLCPYPPALFELIEFLKEAQHV